MNRRRFIAGEKHHWWPVSLSNHWTDESGLVGRIDAEGRELRLSPTRIANISDGHNIRLGPAWDTTFEGRFDNADSAFPEIIKYLEQAVARHKQATDPVSLQAHECNDSDLELLCEALVSLAIRSPRFRHGAVKAVQSLRTVAQAEHKNLIAANLHQTWGTIIRNVSARGKYLVLFSDEREFIFGDGFYHNLYAGSQDLADCKLLVPLTPNIVLLHVQPLRYMAQPRLVTRQASEEDVALVNETVQIYSKDYLFFRSERPALSEHFLRREHLEYSRPDPISQLIDQIPGVIPLRLEGLDRLLLNR